MGSIGGPRLPEGGVLATKASPSACPLDWEPRSLQGSWAHLGKASGSVLGALGPGFLV